MNPNLNGQFCALQSKASCESSDSVDRRAVGSIIVHQLRVFSIMLHFNGRFYLCWEFFYIVL